MVARISPLKALRVAMVASALALLFTMNVETTAAEQDPVAVVNAFIDAYNARNTNAALALFADDAVVNRPPNPSATGKAGIAAWLNETWGRNVTLAPGTAPQVAGDRVTMVTKVTSDPLKQLGIASLEQQEAYVVQGGLIKTYTYELTTASVDKLTQAQGPPACLPGSTCPTGAAAPPAPPAGVRPSVLPVTGAGGGAKPATARGITPRWLATLGGLGVMGSLALGYWLRRRSPGGAE